MHPAAVKQGGLFRINAIGGCACALISLLWYVTIIGPLLEQRATTADLRRQIRDQQQKTDELKAAMASTQQQSEVVREELATGGLELDAAAHLNKRIAVLTDLFADCTLHIDDVQTGRICSGLQCDLVPITIVGRGAYPQCIRFLHRLSSTFPDMNVTRIELKGSSIRTGEPEQFRFEMFWYAAPNSAIPSIAATGTGDLVASGLWGLAR